MQIQERGGLGEADLAELAEGDHVELPVGAEVNGRDPAVAAALFLGGRRRVAVAIIAGLRSRELVGLAFGPVEIPIAIVARRAARARAAHRIELLDERRFGYGRHTDRWIEAAVRRDRRVGVLRRAGRAVLARGAA